MNTKEDWAIIIGVAGIGVAVLLYWYNQTPGSSPGASSSDSYLSPYSNYVGNYVGGGGVSGGNEPTFPTVTPPTDTAPTTTTPVVTPDGVLITPDNIAQIQGAAHPNVPNLYAMMLQSAPMSNPLPSSSPISNTNPNVGLNVIDSAPMVGQASTGTTLVAFPDGSIGPMGGQNNPPVSTPQPLPVFQLASR